MLDEERLVQETRVPVLKIEGNFSRLRARPAHFVGHLPITERRLLFPSSCTRTSVRVSCETPTLSGGVRAYHVLHTCLGGLGPASFAGGWCCLRQGRIQPLYPPRCLLAQVCQPL